MRVLGNPLAPPGVKADVTLGLKHLTASSQRNRDSFMACGGLQFLVPQLAADSAEAQYNRCAPGCTSQGRKFGECEYLVPQLAADSAEAQYNRCAPGYASPGWGSAPGRNAETGSCWCPSWLLTQRQPSTTGALFEIQGSWMFKEVPNPYLLCSLKCVGVCVGVGVHAWLGSELSTVLSPVQVQAQKALLAQGWS